MSKTIFLKEFLGHAPETPFRLLTDEEVGDHARLDGYGILENGTLVSNADAPVKIGNGVSCKDFIVSIATEKMGKLVLFLQVPIR